jgi:vacuolar-type H+-ATPase subunit I/STV1
MVEVLKSIVHFLNYYANLILVLITTVYVGLTWRTLHALKEASLREREALHLREIKDRVIEPIVSWIAQTVQQRFSGGSPSLLVVSTVTDKSRVITHTIDDPFFTRRRLKLANDDLSMDALGTWVSTESGRISKYLFDEAKAAHFKEELSQFDALIEEVRKLTEDLTTLANQSVADLAASKIPQAATYEAQNVMPEWTSPHDLAVCCMEGLLRGQSRVVVEVHGMGAVHTLVDEKNTGLARAADGEQLRHWAELGFERTRRRWESVQFATKIAELLERSEAVRRTIEELSFTQTLGVECAIIGGRKKRWFAFMLG